MGCQMNQKVFGAGFFIKHQQRIFLLKLLFPHLIQGMKNDLERLIHFLQQFASGNVTERKLEFTMPDVTGMAQNRPNVGIQIAHEMQTQIAGRIGNGPVDNP